MLPSKYGMAPIGSGLISHQKSFMETTSAMFAMPDNTQSNQKYISELIHTSDPVLPIQKDRENQILKSGMPKICYVSFYPQGYEFFIQPIFDYIIKNTKSILSFFVIPNEPCNVYFECEDPNVLNHILRGIPELPKNQFQAQILPNANTFVQYFCNFNAFSHISVGNFIQVSEPEFEGDFAQIISVDKENKKCLVKLIPRIDYENISKYHLTTQTEINNLMPAKYRPPKALFDKNKLLQINSSAEFGSKIITVNDIEIDLTTWDGKKFYGSFQYKRFHFESIKTIIPKIKAKDLEIFRKNVFSKERHIKGFFERTERIYSGTVNAHEIAPISRPEINPPALLSRSSSKLGTKNKFAFTIPEDDFKNSKSAAKKKSEVNSIKKPESKSKDKTDLVTSPSEEKSSPTQTEEAKKTSDEDSGDIKPGDVVIPTYGQFTGLFCRVKSNDGKMITAELCDHSVSVPSHDFSPKSIETSKKTCEMGIQSSNVPIDYVDESDREPSPKDEKSDVVPEKVDECVQHDPDYEFIPRQDDFVMLQTGERGIILDDENIILEATGEKRKVKGAEILQAVVEQDNNTATDSRGERLNVNEEVKIKKGRNAGNFIQIEHIAKDSLFAKINGKYSKVDLDDIKKLKEDAQKVDTEDIIGENLVILKKGEVPSEPMRIQKMDTSGNIWVENVYKDKSADEKCSSVKLKNFSSKWMFESDIPLEMRFGGTYLNTKKRKFK